jgi:hypothetical protein
MCTMTGKVYGLCCICLGPHVNTEKVIKFLKESGLCFGNEEIIAVTEAYEVSVSINVVREGHMTVAICYIWSRWERNVFVVWW